MGMGGAAVALPNGAESAYWNPGALGAPDNPSGFQVPVGLHAGVTGNSLKAANDLDKIQDDCQAGGAGNGSCSQANINNALNEFNGGGVRADVGGGLGIKAGRAAFFVNNFTYISGKPRASFNATATNNISNNTSELVVRGISMTEFGAAYGHELSFAPGLFVGGAAKLISANTGFTRLNVVSEDLKLDKFTDNERRSIQPGFDLGMFWDASRSFEHAWGHPRMGLTARNVNNPKFRNPDAAVAAGQASKYSVQGGLRLGAAVSPLPFWNIAADADLTRNVTALEGVSSQNLGLGTEINVFNRSWINIPLRAGLSRNLAQGGRNSLSLGVGLNFVHVNVDLGVTSSPRTQQIQSQGENKKFPNEISGGGQIAFLFGGGAEQRLDSTKENFQPTK